MKVALWHIYDAALYAPAGNYSPEKPYALKLFYHQNIDGKKIVDTSIQEIRKNGLNSERILKRWSMQLSEIFPQAIKPGESLTGVYTGKKTVFCQDGRKLGSINGQEFARHFFGIWLSEKTSLPDLRRKLLGKS